jgi:hypothetical protein
LQLLAAALAALTMCLPARAWNNGQKGNTTTTTKAECSNPPYGTHDWIADRALGLLPDVERAWLVPHRAIYLIGTEAPDHRLIPMSCGVPHRGYDDRSQGHSVEWNGGATEMTNDRPARRAQEEYSKAVIAFEQGHLAHAAFFLGAMAHYIGDCAQYGHNYSEENNHGNYEAWAAALTASPTAPTFNGFVNPDALVARRPYTATRRVSRAAFVGQGSILPAQKMDVLFAKKPQEFINSAGASLNLVVNELADVLHTFFLNVVDQDDD